MKRGEMEEKKQEAETKEEVGKEKEDGDDEGRHGRSVHVCTNIKIAKHDARTLHIYRTKTLCTVHVKANLSFTRHGRPLCTMYVKENAYARCTIA